MKVFGMEEYDSNKVYIAELYDACATQTGEDGRECAYRSAETGKYVAVVKNEEGRYVDLESGLEYGSEDNVISVRVGTLEDGSPKWQSLYPCVSADTKYSRVYEAETGKKAKARISKRKAVKLAQYLTEQKRLEKEEGVTV